VYIKENYISRDSLYILTRYAGFVQILEEASGLVTHSHYENK